MRFLPVLLAALGVLSQPALGGLLYDRQTAPSGWTRLEAASLQAPVQFTLGLQAQNLQLLEDKFWRVSDPNHAEYQQFLSIEEINQLVAAKEEEQEKVQQWLRAGGVSEKEMRNFGDAIEVRTSVEVASKLFSAEFFEFVNKKEEKVVKAWGPQSLPAEIHPLISLVSGLSSFPIPHLKTLREASSSFLKADQTGIIAQSLAAVYGLPTESLSSSTKTSQSVVEFQGQSYAPSDLSLYSSQIARKLEVLPKAHIIGPNDPSTSGTESTLDIEMMASVNIESSSWFWLEDASNWLYEFSLHFFNTKEVPLVNSISYGWWESDQCTVDSAECSALGVNGTVYAEKVNVQFQKIGLRGISLVASSGDSGANGRTDGECLDPQLRAAFPSSSPFVTSVGATQLNQPKYELPNAKNIPLCNQGFSCASSGEEVAVSYDISGFASGGGFSDIFPTPSYQEKAVKEYLASGVTLPPTKYYNASGRGAPDIAAIGHNGLIIQNGQATAVGGTSMSAPIIAAIFSLLNEAQLALNGKPLGFLNPLIYKAAEEEPAAFTDVTVGDNACTEQGCQFWCEGFKCAKGWDPVSGVGSPNFAKLKEFIKKIHQDRQVKFGPKLATQ